MSWGAMTKPEAGCSFCWLRLQTNTSWRAPYAISTGLTGGSGLKSPIPVSPSVGHDPMAEPFVRSCQHDMTAPGNVISQNDWPFDEPKNKIFNAKLQRARRNAEIFASIRYCRACQSESHPPIF